MQHTKRVALVTGAGRGIGRAIAKRLAKDGYDVAINDINAESAYEVFTEIKTLGRDSLSIPADVSIRENVLAMVDEVVDYFGRLDVMVCNAGIVQVKPILEYTEEDLEKIFRLNVFGVLYGIQAAAKQMIKQGKGKIINASSTSGKRGLDLLGSYAGTKFAVIGITQSAARELGRYGIRVNAYCPGVVATNMWQEIDALMCKYLDVPKGETLKKQVEKIPLGRLCTPDDVANVVSFLASDDADYLTGQVFVIDGGMLSF